MKGMKRLKEKYSWLGVLRIIFQIASLLLMVVFLFLALSQRENITVETLLDYTPQNKVLATLLFMVMYAFKSLSFVFPMALLFITGGILFSPFFAILINTLGVAISLSVPYWMGRHLGAKLTEKLALKYEKIGELQMLQQENDFFFSYLIRVIGILPCDVVSLYMGSIEISYPQYILGGVLGFLPRVIATTLIGGSITDPRSSTFLFACLFNIFLTLVSLEMYKKGILKHKGRLS